MYTRILGRSGIEISGLGLGCWAIGGPFWRGDRPVGWGEVDDKESIRALERALELGVTFFDTADVYGCGHSERILGQVLSPRREQVIIATKFGNIFDEQSRYITGASGEPAYIRQACEASLRRLRTDYIDLYQFHIGNYDLNRAEEVLETLEQLVDEGKIRWYGWSTDDPERAAFFAQGEHCAAIQQRFNLFEGNVDILAICEEQNLASINRGPLAQGLLTGKFTPDSRLPENDVRRDWDFRTGEQARRLRVLNEVREVLTAGGRTLAQGAIGWLWARSPVTVPIPGFKTVAQVEENANALELGPLSPDQMAEIDELLARYATA
ncbi:aldo/keto reductase [Litorilinea aerophila]|uniref:Aldo/keto reductase n=1 Tax=Litorilinea aerophila TaxID=1204385 RepID=A0A540VJ21_9CHLR|nr:aldo/keto reductase [Litorilinea aerophila]MCC9075636.1 aldo/keto reductase [Litorilinea aerophila]OUC08688.1 aldo/keto reductase [Litorilinea aerophila]